MHSAKLFLLIDFKRRNPRTLGKEGWHGKSKHMNSMKDLPSLKFSELYLAVEAKILTLCTVVLNVWRKYFRQVYYKWGKERNAKGSKVSTFTFHRYIKCI